MKKYLLILFIAVSLSIKSIAGGPVKLSPVEPIPVVKKVIPVYLGVGIATGRYSAACSANCKYSDITSGVVLRVGYEYNQYIGLEARYIGTFFGANTLRGQKIRHAGLYLKPTYSLSEDFNMYGLLGYGWTKSISSGKVKLLTVNDSGVSAGVGLEYDLSTMDEDYDPNIYYPEGFDGQADQEIGWGLFVDYQRLLIKSNTPGLDVVSAGVTYDF